SCAVASSPLEVSSLARDQRLALQPIDPAFAAYATMMPETRRMGAGRGARRSALRRRDLRRKAISGNRPDGVREALPRITWPSAQEIGFRAGLREGDRRSERGGGHDGWIPIMLSGQTSVDTAESG